MDISLQSSQWAWSQQHSYKLYFIGLLIKSKNILHWQVWSWSKTLPFNFKFILGGWQVHHQIQTCNYLENTSSEECRCLIFDFIDLWTMVKMISHFPGALAENGTQFSILAFDEMHHHLVYIIVLWPTST